MLHVEAWYVSVHRVPCLHVEGSETFVTEILPYTHAVISVTHSWVVVLSMHCVQTRRDVYCGSYVTWAAPWWNMVLLRWTCQSHGQSSQFQEKGRKRVKTHTERGGGGGGVSKTSIPSSQSPSTEPLKWCRFSREACRVELGEGGPNVTLASWSRFLSITIGHRVSSEQWGTSRAGRYGENQISQLS